MMNMSRGYRVNLCDLSRGIYAGKSEHVKFAFKIDIALEFVPTDNNSNSGVS